MFMLTESIVVFLVLGLIAGWLASKIVEGTGYGLIGDMVIGVIGALIGGSLLPVLGIDRRPGMLRAIITAFIGAFFCSSSSDWSEAAAGGPGSNNRYCTLDKRRAARHGGTRRNCQHTGPTGSSALMAAVQTSGTAFPKQSFMGAAANSWVGWITDCPVGSSDRGTPTLDEPSPDRSSHGELKPLACRAHHSVSSPRSARYLFPEQLRQANPVTACGA
jgi:uncharacterized membrane protein YeaQ/YmgE (transglycosylase-associated protein family)